MPTRQQKQEVRAELERLEAGARIGDVNPKDINFFEDMLNSYGFPVENSYRGRVKGLRELAEKWEEPINFGGGERDYVGMIDRIFVQATPVYDHVFLSRLYGRGRRNRIRLSWRFNQEGRIDLIDTRILESEDPKFRGEIRHLLTVEGYRERGKAWEIAESYCLECVPQEMSCFWDGFLGLGKPEKYQVVLNEGHETAGLITDGLREDRIANFRSRGTQMRLSDIRNDRAAVYMVRNAAGLYPLVFENGNGLTIEYGH